MFLVLVGGERRKEESVAGEQYRPKEAKESCRYELWQAREDTALVRRVGVVWWREDDRGFRKVVGIEWWQGLFPIRRCSRRHANFPMILYTSTFCYHDDELM
jgi:hypothetical protein